MKNIDKKELLEVIKSNLSDEEAYMLRLRWGLIDDKTHSMDEISSLLNISRDQAAKELRKIESYVLSYFRKV